MVSRSCGHAGTDQFSGASHSVLCLTSFDLSESWLRRLVLDYAK